MRSGSAFVAGVLSVAAGLLLAAPDAAAIEKEDLRNIPAGLEPKVFAFFAKVPVYYQVTERGDNLVMGENKPVPGVDTGSKYFVLLFVNPDEAERFRLQSERRDTVTYVTRETTLDLILQAQFAKLKQAASRDDADFVVTDVRLGFPVRIEYLADSEDAQKPMTDVVWGGHEVPAFVSEVDAVSYQQAAERASGNSIVRVGLDFKDFLYRVAVPAARSGTPLVVYGYGAR